MTEFLYGHWAVHESLRAGRRPLEQLLISETAEEKGRIAEIITLAEQRGVKVRRVPRRIIDDLADGNNHQNVVMRAGPYPYAQIDDAFALAERRGEKPFFLLLDLLKDPQNVGVLLRVADVVGVHGVIMQERRSVSVTPSVVSASSGAVEHLNFVQVTNLVTEMKALKERDMWLVGLDLGPNLAPYDQPDLNMSLGLVLGSEGEGMRRLVRETCDMLLTLPMRGNVGSLNVATVGSIALYSAWQSRSWQGWERP